MQHAPTFFRLHTDRTREPAFLEGVYAGPFPSACWLLGGGPSLARLPYRRIAASPVPKMAVNLAGAGLLRPTFWTSYDTTSRFHASIYLDAGIAKFLHPRRAMDLVPGTTYKVCECPNTYFFERDGQRAFADFLAPGQTGIVDWADSLVQAIDILYRLGFRRVLLAGCEMRMCPSPAQIALALRAGVHYQHNGLLKDFLAACEAAGLPARALDEVADARHYHFDETKPIAAAANTDLHYFRVAQYLRLSRRAMSLAGLELLSVTPGSRLNDFLPYVSVRAALDRLHRDIPDPAGEPTRGLYRQTEPRTPPGIGPMRDYLPLNWKHAPAHNRQLERAAGRAADSVPPARRVSSSSGRTASVTASRSQPDRVAARLERQELVAVEPAEAASKQARALAALEVLTRRRCDIREEG